MTNAASIQSLNVKCYFNCCFKHLFSKFLLSGYWHLIPWFNYFFRGCSIESFIFRNLISDDILLHSSKSNRPSSKITANLQFLHNICVIKVFKSTDTTFLPTLFWWRFKSSSVSWKKLPIFKIFNIWFLSKFSCF